MTAYLLDRAAASAASMTCCGWMAAMHPCSGSACRPVQAVARDAGRTASEHDIARAGRPTDRTWPRAPGRRGARSAPRPRRPGAAGRSRSPARGRTPGRPRRAGRTTFARPGPAMANGEPGCDACGQFPLARAARQHDSGARSLRAAHPPRPPNAPTGHCLTAAPAPGMDRDPASSGPRLRAAQPLLGPCASSSVHHVARRPKVRSRCPAPAPRASWAFCSASCRPGSYGTASVRKGRFSGQS